MRLLLLPFLLLALFLPPAGAKPPVIPFAKWEKEIAAYEAQDRAEPPPKGAIVFVGSSSIRLWKTLAEDFPRHRVLNRGFGGSQLADSVHFAGHIRGKPGLKFIDVFPRMPGADGRPRPEIFVADRLHMNAGGCQLWTESIGAERPAPDR